MHLCLLLPESFASLKPAIIESPVINVVPFLVRFPTDLTVMRCF